MTDELISKHSVKIQLGTLITAVIFVIYTTLSVQTKFNNQDNAINELRIKDTHLEDEIHKNIEDIEVLKEKANTNAVHFADITARLVNIEKSLSAIHQEIAKHSIKNLNK